MIQTATKYARIPSPRAEAAAPDDLPRPARRLPPRGFQVLIPRAGALVSLGEWFWRELREGGMLRRYLRAERHRLKDQVRKVGRRYQDWRQNPKSDWQLEYAVPARLYHRWFQEDPDFWKDRSNLQSLKRDNPELTIKV